MWAGRIAESFKTDPFVIWSEDNSEKLIIRCYVLGGADKNGEGGMGAIEDILCQLENTMLNPVSIRGDKDIKRVFLLEHGKVTVSGEGTIEARKEKEWVLETDGVNLKTVMCIDGVFKQLCRDIECPWHRSSSWRYHERTTGCHRVRSYVNYRHPALLCDLMTHRGSLVAITRHGINRADTGALMRCSFEETVEILTAVGASRRLISLAVGESS
jgi:DNA-directed RNA polymerase II subunit RPB1